MFVEFILPVLSLVFRALTTSKAQWDALEASGALNSSQWPSWKTWEQLDENIRNGSLVCQDGLAIAEKGNPLQTFRCNNVSLANKSSSALVHRIYCFG